MPNSSRNVAAVLEDPAKAPPPAASDADLAAAWFDEPPPSTRRTLPPSKPAIAVGEFIGDELADGWLR